MWATKNSWPWVENGKKTNDDNAGSGLGSSTWAKWPCSVEDGFGRGPTRSCSAIPGHSLGELRWQGMCASGMRLDKLCLGKVVYPTNRVEDRNSLITTILSLQGFLCSKSPCCPLQPVPVTALGTGHPWDTATPEQLYTELPCQAGMLTVSHWHCQAGVEARKIQSNAGWNFLQKWRWASRETPVGSSLGLNS